MEDLVVEKVMSLAQRRKRAQELRRLEPKLVRQRAVKRKRLAGEATIYARAQKLARKMFRIKFAGQQGAHYQSLSPTQKMEVDRLIDQRGKAIQKLAVRLIPIVRMAEYKRFQALKGKHGEPTVPHLQNEEIEQLDEIDLSKSEAKEILNRLNKKLDARQIKLLGSKVDMNNPKHREILHNDPEYRRLNSVYTRAWFAAEKVPYHPWKKPVKEEIEILTFTEVILEDDMSKFNKLLSIGLVDKDKYLQYKKAMSDIRKNAKVAAYREMILNVLDELMDVVTKDPAIYQRVKMAVEKND